MATLINLYSILAPALRGWISASGAGFQRPALDVSIQSCPFNNFVMYRPALDFTVRGWISASAAGFQCSGLDFSVQGWISAYGAGFQRPGLDFSVRRWIQCWKHFNTNSGPFWIRVATLIGFGCILTIISSIWGLGSLP